MTMGEKIIKLRKVTDMSQEDLADLLGIARQTVSKWELEETPPRIENLLVISEYFDVPISDIVDPDMDVFTDEYMDTRGNFRMKLLNRLNRDMLNLEIKPEEEKEQPQEEKVDTQDEKLRIIYSVEKTPEKVQKKISRKDIDVTDTVAIAKTENIECENNGIIRRRINKLALIAGAVVAFIFSVALFIWAYCEAGTFAQLKRVVDESDLYVYVEWQSIICTVSAIFAVIFLAMVTVLILERIFKKMKLKYCLGTTLNYKRN